MTADRPLNTSAMNTSVRAADRFRDRGVLLWAAVIGILGGLSSAAFREASIGLEWLLTGRTGDLVHVAEDLPPALRLLIPALGGVLAGLALMLGRRLSRGRDSPDYLEAIAVGDGRMLFWPTATRLFSSLCSVGSGTSIGREGGMAQLAALAASMSARWLPGSPRRLRLLVACGGAAGIASAYNAPLAGALFIAEVVLQSLSIDLLGPLVVASAMATLTVQHGIGMRPIFATPEVEPLSPAAFPSVFLLGVAAGVLGPLFLCAIDMVKRLFRPLQALPPLSLGLGGLIVGLLSVHEPQIWGNGSAVVSELLLSPPAWRVVLMLLVLKVLATSTAVGSGAVGGVFTPSLFIGTAFGSLWGDAWMMFLPGSGAAPTAYGVIGMSALLAATTHAPVMAILMVFEMTVDADLLLPLIVASVPACHVATMLRARSVYGAAHGESALRPVCLMQVGDLVRVPPRVVGPEAHRPTSLDSAANVGRDTTRLVVRDAGFPDAPPTASADERLPMFPGSSLGRPVLQPGDGIDQALAAFLSTSLDSLPVVDLDGHRVGEITRVDVLRLVEGTGAGRSTDR